MAMWHRFKPLNLQVDRQYVEVVEDSALISYYPTGGHLNFEIKYYTGNIKSVFGFSTREKKKLALVLPEGEYKITILEHGDEQVQQVKNLGCGALIGAAIAGPFGAAAGAYLGSKRKECPSIIEIPELNVRLEALAPIGYLKDLAKNQFFSDKEPE
ncbi:TPA: hypothetical protein ACPJZV_000693 [Vibrio diabolicus]